MKKPHRLRGELKFEDVWPSTLYGPEGQVQVFNSPLEVPEGWHDNPKKVGDPKAKTILPFYEEALAAAESDIKEGIDEEVKEDATVAENKESETGAPADGQPEEGVQDAAQEVIALAPVDELDKEELVGRLNLVEELKGRWQPNWSKQRLYDLLADHLNAN